MQERLKLSLKLDGTQCCDDLCELRELRARFCKLHTGCDSFQPGGVADLADHPLVRYRSTDSVPTDLWILQLALDLIRGVLSVLLLHFA